MIKKGKWESRDPVEKARGAFKQDVAFCRLSVDIKPPGCVWALVWDLRGRICCPAVGQGWLADLMSNVEFD